MAGKAYRANSLRQRTFGNEQIQQNISFSILPPSHAFAVPQIVQPCSHKLFEKF